VLYSHKSSTQEVAAPTVRLEEQPEHALERMLEFQNQKG
jgi:hypothetical protein